MTLAGFFTYIGSSVISEYNQDKIWSYIIWCFTQQEFNVFNQLVFPFISGLIGGLASYYIGKADSAYDSRKLNGKGFLYIWLGGLAGWLAVNLLNPSGTISQVSVLGFIAGMSGVTYLKRNALVEASEEKRMFGVEARKEDFFNLYGDEDDQEIVFNVSDFAMADEERESIKQIVIKENEKFSTEQNQIDSDAPCDKKG